MTKVKKRLLRPIIKNSINDISRDSKIYTKGGEDLLNQSLPQINEILTELRQHADYSIKNMDPKLKEKFDQMIYYIDTLYDTDSYHILHDLIKQKFDNLTKIQPATIGSYFFGCFNGAKVHDLAPACSPTCASSIPPKSEVENSRWTTCDKTVLWAMSTQNNTYKFVQYNKIPSSSDALLFIDIPNLEVFKGFTLDEKNEIKKLDIDRVKIYGLNIEQNKYIPLTNDYIPLSEIKTRDDTYSSDPPIEHSTIASNGNMYNLSNNCSCSSISGIAIAILVIVIVIAILYFISIFK